MSEHEQTQTPLVGQNDEPTIAAVIAKVLEMEPSADVCVKIEVWNSLNGGNSGFGIWNGVDHFNAKSLSGALALYLADFTVRGQCKDAEPFVSEASVIISKDAKIPPPEPLDYSEVPF